MSIMYARQRASDSETGWLHTRSQVTPDRSTRLDARRYRSRSNSSISRDSWSASPRMTEYPWWRAIPPPSPSSDDRELPAGLVQPLGPVGGGRGLGLDPDAEAPLQVDPWLVREGHARLERRFVPLHDVRGLVDLEPDPMAGPMDESIAVARVRDHRTSRPVDVLRRDAGADRPQPRLPGRQDEIGRAHV